MHTRSLTTTVLVVALAASAALARAPTTPASSALASTTPASAAPASSGPEATARIDVKSIVWTIPEAPIVLGETDGVELTVRAERPDGGELDVAAPRFWASTGALTAPVRVKPGVWTTRFTPPKDRFPHVAIVSATVDTASGPAVGFAAVPLWGKGRLEVKTKPKSSVVVYIGNTSFGPAKADEKGVALVDMKAPPGPENAVAESTDVAGNVSSRTVPLSVPPFSRIALMAVDRVASADGAGAATLLLFLVDKKGAPLFDASATELEASVGTFDGAPQGLAPGVFRVRYLPGVTTEHEGRVTVRMKGAKGSTASVAVRLIPGGPKSAELALSTTTVNVDDDGLVLVTARFADQGGNTTPAESATLTVDVGRLESPRVTDDERLTMTWVLPEKRGAGTARVTARTLDGAVLGEADVTLVNGRPAALTISPVGPLVADGRSAALVVVKAFDRAGNEVPSDGATLATDEGQIVGLDVTKDGTVARFVPAPVREEARATLTARLGDVRAERTVRLIPPPLPFLTVMPALRADWNYGRFFAAGPELSMFVRLPGLLDETLHLGLDVALLPSVPLPVTTEGGQTLIRSHVALPVVVEGAWRPLFFDALRLHVGAGVGATVGDLTLTSEETIIPQRTVVFAVGAHAALGVGYRLGPGELEAMLRLGYFAPIARPEAYLGTPTGASLSLGYRFGL